MSIKKIYLGADHGGYERKVHIAHFLQQEGYTVEDCGAHSFEADDDYPTFAKIVATHVQKEENAIGILSCRSGEGMAMTANRFTGVRAAVIWNEKVAIETRKDNNANIAVLPADFLSEEVTMLCLRHFLTTNFSDAPRHSRRIQEMDNK